MYIQFIKLRIYPAAIIFTSMIGSVMSPVYAAEKPYQKKFVVTAYYSPLPEQCCYYRGSYEEEIMFNGKGVKGADGTPVYPGMVAAPPAYSFGTVIDLPGIGVGTVHDRGSRIIEWGDDIHRIDVWMGYGEEGLARALAFGTRQVTGTVYPADSEKAPSEGIILDILPSGTAYLSGLPKTDSMQLLTMAKNGEINYSSRLLQETLKENGYFEGPTTGQFGPVTKAALKKFLSDYSLGGDGNAVSEEAAATLISASGIKPKNLPDLVTGIGPGARGDQVRQVQKLLRYLGFYRGRTDGIYDEDLKSAVLAFQLQAGVIDKSLSTGAGRVGPATKAAILKHWKVRQAAVKSRQALMRNKIISEEKALVPAKVLSKGDKGPAVKLLQLKLKGIGYLTESEPTSNFGEKTYRAVLAYQLDRKIITSKNQHGAGVFGPATRKALLKDAVEAEVKQIRTEGARSGK
ncbi:hypothetical protein A3J34_00675 [Candidatus Peribacteria bacterium RIFCSPLOWO2_02_FULL_51_10]|nr:MAG: hypothetical protein A3C52_01685 [Candidatus Peribacteria bacterium RIFCSPHIGHO2_02_FULL_51_15]OGJ68216.1 MAG: hypothetical protein A3J34_00675 [Candidatus Peribacteria bacterium RIFCSPLOWO2_02_FULL_51_10]